jgi:MFS family permease
LVAITYGIQPYGSHSTGWTNPWVLAGLIGGVALLVAFVVIEQRVAHPMVTIGLFRIRAFTMGNIAGLMASVGRGGLQFMLIIWLQGIWLPLHGYSYESTPLWAGIYMLPLTVGFLVAGPVSGWLSDHYGARRFATGGSLVVGATFVALLLIPVDFSYWVFALILLVNGIGSGLFSAPNTTVVMNSVPAYERGAASGVRGTVFNSGSALSIGVFFSLMIVGLANVLPKTLTTGLTGQGVPTKVAEQIGNLPPVGSLFASFLGYNPIGSLLGPSGVLDKLPAANAQRLTGKEFFPNLMSGPFHHGLIIVFLTAAAMMLVAAVASWAAGGRYVHDEQPGAGDEASTEAAGEALGRDDDTDAEDVVRARA